MVLRSTNMVCVLVWLGFYVWLYKPRTRATGGCMLYICRQQKMGVLVFLAVVGIYEQRIQFVLF